MTRAGPFETQAQAAWPGIRHSLSHHFHLPARADLLQWHQGSFRQRLTIAAAFQTRSTFRLRVHSAPPHLRLEMTSWLPPIPQLCRFGSASDMLSRAG